MIIKRNSKFINNIIYRIKIPLRQYSKMMKEYDQSMGFEWDLRAVIADEVRKLLNK